MEIDKENDKENWPGYIILKDKMIILFPGELKLSCCSLLIRKEDALSWGRIDVNKWVCYNKEGRDIDATMILKETLSV
jgi:hypothetical protein